MRALILLVLLSGCANRAWTSSEVGVPEFRSEAAEPFLEGGLALADEADGVLLVRASVKTTVETRRFEVHQIARYERYEHGPRRSLSWFAAAAAAGAAGAWATYGERSVVTQEVVATGGSSGNTSPLEETAVTEPVAPPAVGVALLATAGGFALGGTIQLASPLAPPMNRTVTERQERLASTWAGTPLGNAEVSLRFSTGDVAWRGRTDDTGAAVAEVRLPESGPLPVSLALAGPGAAVVQHAALRIDTTEVWGAALEARTAQAVAAGDLAGARTLLALAPAGSPGEDAAGSAWCAGTAALVTTALGTGDLSAATAILGSPPPAGACEEIWDANRTAVRDRALRAVRREDLDLARGWAALMRQDAGAPDAAGSVEAEIADAAERLAEREERAEAAQKAREERARQEGLARIAQSWRGRITLVLAACDVYTAELSRRKRRIYAMQADFDPRVSDEVEGLQSWIERQQTGEFGRRLEDLRAIMGEMQAAEYEGGSTQLLQRELAVQASRHCE